MASAYTPYKLANGKVVNIPNSELNRLMTVCKNSEASTGEAFHRKTFALKKLSNCTRTGNTSMWGRFMVPSWKSAIVLL